ncbi:ribonuclease H-like domain-containing protein [Tanacetum coccineum]
MSGNVPPPVTGGGRGGGVPPPTGDNPPVVLINNLDAGNPLHVHNSDNSSSVLIPFKLLGTENYRMWNNAMKLALQARNKYGFVDGTCLRDSFADSEVLCAQWDRCNAMKDLNETYDKFDGSMFLMGLDDCYQPVRTALLTRDPLPDVKDAYATVSREESHRGIPETSEAIDTKMNATSFACLREILYNQNKKVIQQLIIEPTPWDDMIYWDPPRYKKGSNASKQNGFKPNFNANCDTKEGDKQPTACNSPTSLIADQMQKLLNLINDTTSGNTQANMAR